MAKIRNIMTQQKFTAIHASVHNHFNQDRHLNRRDSLKQNRLSPQWPRGVNWQA